MFNYFEKVSHIKRGKKHEKTYRDKLFAVINCNLISKPTHSNSVQPANISIFMKCHQPGVTASSTFHVVGSGQL